MNGKSTKVIPNSEIYKYMNTCYMNSLLIGYWSVLIKSLGCDVTNTSIGTIKMHIMETVKLTHIEMTAKLYVSAGSI